MKYVDFSLKTSLATNWQNFTEIYVA